MPDKYLYNNAGVKSEREAIDTSAGGADAGKIPALDGTGRLSNTMMPVGIGADTKQIDASENLAAGDYVNIHNSSGAKVRKADATVVGKRAHGFVLSAVTTGNPAEVYFEGANTAVTGKTPGAMQYLDDSTPGGTVETPPTTAGHIVQALGVATDAAEINTEIDEPIVLA